MFKILKKQVLSPNVKLFVLDAPLIAHKCQPGQFVILRIDEVGERVPLTIADFDREAGTITIVIQEVGASSKQLGQMEEGQSILDVAGPLGHPTDIHKMGTVVCVGGGLGIAPIYPIARGMQQAGNKVYSIIGARNKDLLIYEEELSRYSEVLVATDDGSKGTKGLVTQVLIDLIEKGEKIERVMAIGPVVMMRAVAEATRPYGIKTIVSLNPIMVDGTGMCGCCRVSVADQNKFACVDGPEFDAHEVDFANLMVRQRMFKADEQESCRKQEEGHVCRCH